MAVFVSIVFGFHFQLQGAMYSPPQLPGDQRWELGVSLTWLLHTGMTAVKKATCVQAGTDCVPVVVFKVGRKMTPILGGLLVWSSDEPLG